MKPNDTPKTMDELLAALADGELDLRDQPELAAQLAQNAQAGQAIARHQQLKQACAKAMDGLAMKCPPELAAQLRTMANDVHGVDEVNASGSTPATTKQQAPYTGPPVLARIGQWAPAAVAAVLLVAATVMFIQARDTGTDATGVASVLTASDVDRFDSRHGDCAMKPDILKQHEQFGSAGDLEQLPVKLGDYFKSSTDGMRLSLDAIGYNYQLTGVCGLPGSGAVHIVYHHQSEPDTSISLWLRPDSGQLDDMEADRLYVETGSDTAEPPVLIWRTDGMVYYLVGDSVQDAFDAVSTLRNPA